MRFRAAPACAAAVEGYDRVGTTLEMAFLRRRFALMLATSGQQRKPKRNVVRRLSWHVGSDFDLFWIACRAIPSQLLLCSLRRRPTGSGNRPYAQTAFYSQSYRKGSDEQRDSLSFEPQCSHDRDACGAGSRKIELPHTKRRGQSRILSGITGDQRLAHRRRGGKSNTVIAAAQYRNRPI